MLYTLLIYRYTYALHIPKLIHINQNKITRGNQMTQDAKYHQTVQYITNKLYIYNDKSYCIVKI